MCDPNSGRIAEPTSNLSKGCHYGGFDSPLRKVKKYNEVLKCPRKIYVSVYGVYGPEVFGYVLFSIHEILRLEISNTDSSEKFDGTII